MSDKYGDMLKDWYKKLADAMADDGRLDDQELSELRRDYKHIVDSAIAERDALAAATGYDPEGKGSEQSGRAGSYNAMSQDQGTKLEGLFVSVRGHVANIDAVMENVAEKMGLRKTTLPRLSSIPARVPSCLTG